MKHRQKAAALFCAAAFLSSCGTEPAETTVTETAAVSDTAAMPETTAAPETTAVSESGITAEPAEERPEEALPRMDGSTSAIPLEIGLKSGFLGISYAQAKRLVTHTTTHDSFKRLLGGEVDLILSVPISEEQRKMADEAGVTLFMEPIAKEGFVFVVNAENPVDSLTSEQLRGIYSGAITNWAEVGGRDEPIHAYQRNTDSGSQNYMTVFMGDTPLMPPKKEYTAGGMGSLMSAVAAYDNSAGAIGYSVYSYAAQMYENTDRVKFIAVDGVAPSKTTMADESYPLLSCTYAIYTDRSAGSAEEFVRRTLSDEGQGCVLDSGYLPVNGMEVPERYLPYEAVGTGEPKPADFAPSREYCYLDVRDGNGIQRTGDGYYRLTLLKDEAFQERINADIRTAMDGLKQYDDPKYHTDGTERMSGIRIGASCRNGYLSLTLYYPDSETEVDPMAAPMLFDYAVTLNYDLIAEKKIERFSDLFYEGENFLPDLNEKIGSSTEEVCLFAVDDVQRLDFSGILGEPRLFTINGMISERDNPYLTCMAFLPFAEYGDSYVLSLHSPAARYRDMSEILNDIHAPHVRTLPFAEWEMGYIAEDGKIYFTVVRSAFHTEEEIAEKKAFYRTLQDRAREYFAQFGYEWETENAHWVRMGIRFSENPNAHYVQIGEMVFSFGDTAYANFDTDTLEIITLDTLIGENWREYLQGEDREFLREKGIETLYLSEWYVSGDTVMVAAVYPNEEAYNGYGILLMWVPKEKVNPRYLGSE